MTAAFLVTYRLGSHDIIIRGCLNSQRQARLYVKHLIANKFSKTHAWKHLRGKDTWSRELEGVTETLNIIRKSLHQVAQSQIREDADNESDEELHRTLRGLLRPDEFE